MKALAAALVVLSVGCSESHPDRSAAWPSVLEALPRDLQAIYAPSFQGAPPEGQFLRLSLHPTSDGDPCQDYRTDFASAGDLTFVRLTTNGYQSGSFSIVEFPVPGSAPQAQLRVIHAANGTKVASYLASGGILDLKALPPTLDDVRGGQPVVADVHATFAADPVTESQCDRSGDKQGSVVVSSCTCTLASGRQTTCVPEAGQSTCCASTGGPAVVWEASVTAHLCSFLCVYNDASLAPLCQSLP